jgi:hypothetical protein
MADSLLMVEGKEVGVDQSVNIGLLFDQVDQPLNVLRGQSRHPFDVTPLEYCGTLSARLPLPSVASEHQPQVRAVQCRKAVKETIHLHEGLRAVVNEKEALSILVAEAIFHLEPSADIERKGVAVLPACEVLLHPQCKQAPSGAGLANASRADDDCAQPPRFSL